MAQTPKTIPGMVKQAFREDDDEKMLAYRIKDYLAQKFGAALLQADKNCEKQIKKLWDNITKGI